MAGDGGKSVRLSDLVAEQVKKTPDAIAVIYDGMERESAACQRITYLEMWQRADQVLEELQKLGALSTPVGICLEPGLNLPSVLIGILRSSRPFFPFGVDGLGFVKQSLQKLDVTYLILDTSTLQSLEPLLQELHVSLVPDAAALRALGLFLGKIYHQGTGKEEGVLQPVPDLAYCITTSGTTGTPKIVRVPHNCIMPNILDFRKEFQPEVGDLTFLTSPLTFDPSMIELFVTLTSGAALLVAVPTVKMCAKSLLSVLTERHRVTILQMTPSLFRQLDPDKVRSSLLGADSPLRVAALGGEGFPGQGVWGVCLHPENNTAVYNVYGITEVSCWATLCCARQPRGRMMDRVPIGQPLSKTELKVLDENGDEVKSGTGHIWIGSLERVCLLNDETEGALKRKNTYTWRRTGDLGLVHSDGTVYCLGRGDRQVKRSGKRLDLDTLEKVCCQMSIIEDCRAIFRDNKLHLFCKAATTHSNGNDNDDDDDEENGGMCRDVVGHVTRTLPSQYHPDGVVVVDSFPVNRHGKLDVPSLLHLVKNNPRPPTIPSTSVCVQSWCEEVWQDMPGVNKPVSQSETFLSCGGDSLKAVRITEQVLQHWGSRVPDLLDILLNKTFGDFVSAIQQLVTSNSHDKKGMEVNVKENAQVNGKKRKSDNQLDLLESGDHLEISEFSRNRVDFSESDRSYLDTSESRNYSDLVEPPAKVKKQTSQNSAQNESLKSERLHYSTETNLDISTPCFEKTNDKVMNLASELEDSEGKKTVQHISSNANCPKLLEDDKDLGSSEEELVFVDSISRAQHYYKFEDLSEMCAEDSGENDERKELTVARKVQAVEMELQWSCDTGKCVDASPLVGITRSGRSVVFIGSHSHRFYAVDIDTGSVLWCVELGDRVESSACLSLCGQYIIVGCYDHDIYMLRADTGVIQWRVSTGDVVKCSPVPHKSSNLVFCGSHDGFLYALNCKSQQVEWKSWMGGGGVFSSPTLDSNTSTLYGATLRGHVTALNAATGTVLWRKSLDKPVFSSPSLCDGRLFVGCVDCRLYCLCQHTGQQLWVYTSQAPIFSSPVVTTSTTNNGNDDKNNKPTSLVLFGCHDNCLYCVSHTGELVWKHRTTATVFASPFVFALREKARKSQNGRGCLNGHAESKAERWIAKSSGSRSRKRVTENPHQTDIIHTKTSHMDVEKDETEIRNAMSSCCRRQCFSENLKNSALGRESGSETHTDMERVEGERRKVVCGCQRKHFEGVGRERDPIRDTNILEKDVEKVVEHQKTLLPELAEKNCAACQKRLKKSDTEKTSCYEQVRQERDVCVICENRLKKRENECVKCNEQLKEKFDLCNQVSNQKEERNETCEFPSASRRKTEHEKYGEQKNGKSYPCIEVNDQKDKLGRSEISESNIDSSVSDKDPDQKEKRQKREHSESNMNMFCETCDNLLLGERFVVCASTDGCVRILNCATGSLIGQTRLPGEVFSSPVVIKDRLIVGCRDDRVYCFKLNVCR